MANGSRPNDQDNGDKVSDKLESTPEQKSDGKVKLRPADQASNKLDGIDPAGLEAKAKSETNSGEEDVDASYKTAKGTKYPENFKSSVDKMEESIQDTIFSAKQKLLEESGFSLQDQLGSLLESDGINEDSKTKIIGIFESVVSLAAETHLEKMTSILEETLDFAITKIQEDFDSSVSKYVDVALTEWVAENKLSIHNGIRTQVAESFMDGLKDLLREHYVEIPEDKVDLLKLESEKVKSLETSLNENTDKQVSLVEENKKFAKLLMIEKTINESDLTSIQVDKFRDLSEASEFSTPEQFKKLLENLVSHVSSSDKSIETKFVTEDSDGGLDKPLQEEKTKERDPVISSYLDYMNRSKI